MSGAGSAFLFSTIIATPVNGLDQIGLIGGGEAVLRGLYSHNNPEWRQNVAAKYRQQCLRVAWRDASP